MSELHTGAFRSLNFSRLRINADRMMRRSVQCVAALLLVTLGSGLAWADFDLTFQGLVQTLNTGGSISFNVPAVSRSIRRATSSWWTRTTTASWR